MNTFELPQYVSADRPSDPDGLEAALRDIGARRYHNLHPFHRLLHDGALNRGQVQAWALNRYCYQAHIPKKDALLMARLPSVELRRNGAAVSSITTARMRVRARAAVTMAGSSAGCG